MSELSDEVFCGRCKEDFPLRPEVPKGFKVPMRMGYNFPLKEMPGKIKDQFREWKYICGNCYFDLTDSG